MADWAVPAMYLHAVKWPVIWARGTEDAVLGGACGQSFCFFFFAVNMFFFTCKEITRAG
jgi:hypothetical protein